MKDAPQQFRLTYGCILTAQVEVATAPAGLPFTVAQARDHGLAWSVPSEACLIRTERRVPVHGQPGVFTWEEIRK